MCFNGSVEQDWIGEWNGIYGGMFAPAIDAAKKAFGEKPSPATPALPAAAYTGAYANDYVGAATVTAEGDALVLKVGPDGKTVYPMTHFDRDLFLIYPVPGNGRHAFAGDLRDRPRRQGVGDHHRQSQRQRAWGVGEVGESSY